MEEIKIESTSLSSAVSSDIILRESKTSRLIFRPLIVDNPNDDEASVKGTFVYQRKSSTEDWEDYKTLNLSQFKKGEWIKLELKSAEVLLLFNKLSDLYSLYQQEGLPVGKYKFLKADEGLGALLSAKEDELTQLLDNEPDDASILLSRLINWISDTETPTQVINKLEHLEISGLKQLNSIAGLSILKSSFSAWQENQENNDEEFWQRFLTDYSFILSQLFSHPVIVVEGKAYMGGKSISNIGGNIVDFLAKNNVSNNAVLIEIKTPITPLLGPKYRDNAFSISKDLTGSIVQVINYKYSLQTEFHSLSSQYPYEIKAFEPECIVIAGNFKKQLDDPIKEKSFELFRSSLQKVQIITYDEIFGKVNFLIDLLEGSIEPDDDFVDDDWVPF